MRGKLASLQEFNWFTSVDNPGTGVSRGKQMRQFYSSYRDVGQEVGIVDRAVFANQYALQFQMGVTMLDLLITVIIMGIVGAIATPHLFRLSTTFNHMNARSYLMQDLKRAQAESITQGCRGIFVIRADQKGYYFGCDYLEYDSAEQPQPDVITLRRSLPTHTRVTTTGPVIFNSRGQAVDIYGIISNLQIELLDDSNDVTKFASGMLLGTGVFTFE